MLGARLYLAKSSAFHVFIVILLFVVWPSRLTSSASPLPVAVPIDVIFSIDSSGSMGPPPEGEPPEDYNRDPQSLRIWAAKEFIAKLDPSIHWVGVVSWDREINFAFRPTNRYSEERNWLNQIDSAGGTDLGLGLREAFDQLEKSPRKRSKNLVILLTDGMSNADRPLAQFYSLHDWTSRPPGSRGDPARSGRKNRRRLF